MQVEQLTAASGRVIEGPLLITPQMFGDERGFFFESWNQSHFDEAVGAPITFSQDNHSRSSRGVLRGLHYQLEPEPQGKLVRCPVGAIFDVAVDLRRSSPTFGQWVGAELSAENQQQLWVPVGFAHGFLTLSEAAEVLYKASGYWSKACERSLRCNDPDLAITWPLERLAGVAPQLPPSPRRWRPGRCSINCLIKTKSAQSAARCASRYAVMAAHRLGDSWLPPQGVAIVLRGRQHGRDSASPCPQAEVASGSLALRCPDRGSRFAGLSPASAQGSRQGAMVDLGERQLAAHVCVSRWPRVRSQLRGLPLMQMHNPPHPGEFIEGVYLEPCELSIRQVAERLGVSASTFQRLVAGKSRVSPDMALRLSRVLGRSAESWLSMQDSHDLWQARRRLDLSGLTPMELTPA